MSCERFATIAAQNGLCTDTSHGAVVPPLYLSTNYTFSEFGKPREYDYSRSGNPTRSSLADTLAKLEGGAGAVVTATGMAAATLCTALLGPEDLLIVPHDCYGGCYRLFTSLAKKGSFKLAVVNLNDERALTEAFSRKPKMIWLETPSNPLLRLVDIEAISKIAHEHDTLVVADNTFLSPVLQKPLSLGADIVIHSTTKYVNGHSDVVAGAVVAKTEELASELAWWANCLGITGAPFDSYLTLRGLRTLPLRMKQHQINAEAAVTVLNGHPVVEKVHYPGLPEHPHHELAKRQQSGFGAMLSFELKGNEDTVRAFLSQLKYFALAESLGGVESLVAHPATMTHASMTAEAREEAGISSTLIRLSVGIEDPEDLVADLSQALAYAAHSTFEAIDGEGPSHVSVVKSVDLEERLTS